MAKKQLVAVRGIVKRIVHRNEESGFTVFKIVSGKDDKTIISCAGVSDFTPDLDSSLELFGVFDTASKYPGVHFKYSGISMCVGSHANHVVAFLKSFAKHLGDEKAKALADHFGNDIENVIEYEPERLAEVEGIGGTIIKNITLGWKENRGSRSVQIFLIKLGLPQYKVKEIISHHGHEYQDILEKDPFVLLREGLSFSVCDSIAEKLGMDPTDPIRFKGFIRSTLRNSISMSGHLFITLEELLSEFNNYNEGTHRKFDKNAVIDSQITPFLDELISDGYVVQDREGLYDVRQYFYEARSSEYISKMIETEAAKNFNEVDFDIFRASYEEIERVNNPDFTLSGQQVEALESFLTEKVMVITGAPGTGKTTILKGCVRLLKDAGVKFSLMAPTGIASKRLEQSAGHPASTIHRGLGFQGSGWQKNCNDKLRSDAIIVDEFSMVDMNVFFRLLDALKSRTKLLMVGDVDQLPSVGPGNVLKDLINSGAIKTIRLDKVHRQAETSDIVKVANKIRVGVNPTDIYKINDKSADVCFLKTEGDIERAEKYIVSIAEALKKKKGAGHFQIITPRNEGNLSVASINILLQQTLNPSKGKTGPDSREVHLDKETVIRRGDRVIVIKNNYNLGVYNGDIGKVIRITAKYVVIHLEGGDSLSVDIPIAEIRKYLRLAYAVTVHKSQGMEYPIVIMPLIKAHGRMLLQRNLVYTALTRARKKVFILGQEGALDNAISNDRIQKRNTYLSTRVKECIKNHKVDGYSAMQKLLDLPSSCENAQEINDLLYPKSSPKDDSWVS